jgi:hypothetical protein
MLDVNKLKTELDKVFLESNSLFVGWPSNISQAAHNIAEAYKTYAIDAFDVSLDTLVSYNQPGFENSLLTLNNNSTYLDAATAFDLAFTTFWTGAIFSIGLLTVGTPACINIGGTGIFATEISSTVISIIPDILKNLLLPEFSAVDKNDMIDKTLKIAQCFHTATTSAVVVLITGLDTTPGPGGPLPITNTCTIS